MKKFLKIFFIIFILIKISTAFVTTINGTDPNHPGKCVYKGQILSPGGVYKPTNECLSVHCGNNGLYQTIGCPSVLDVKGCKVVFVDITKPHSECCKFRYDCI